MGPAEYRKNLYAKLGAVLLGLAVGLSVVESTFRLTHGWLYDEFDAIGSVTTTDKYMFHGKFDPELGWIPEGGDLFPYGIRPNAPGRNWQDEIARKPLVLAVGDSFTWGDDVAPSESMPAYLENECRWAVLNAGVGGYGLDQIVLRAEQLVPKLKPDLLLVSYIDDDLRRAQSSFRFGTPKPYFEMDESRLVLRNRPVPAWKHQPNELRRPQDAWWHRSYALTWMLIRLFPARTLEGTTAAMVVPTSAELQQVVTGIFRRLDLLAADSNLAIFVVRLHGNERSPRTSVFSPMEVDERTFRSGFGVRRLRYVNLADELQKLQSDQPERFRTFQAAASPFSGHNSAVGNAYLARRIADHICEKGPAPYDVR